MVVLYQYKESKCLDVTRKSKDFLPAESKKTL